NKKDASKEQPSPDPSNKSNRPQDSNQKKNQKGSSADNSHPDAPNKTNQPQHNDQTKTHETKSTEKVSSGASNLPNISQSDKNDKRSIQVHQTARRASLDDTQSKKKNPTNDRSIDKLINEY
ncbi:unnamed protein product, partial [Rotaria magnacalcarata]